MLPAMHRNVSFTRIIEDAMVKSRYPNKVEEGPRRNAKVLKQKSAVVKLSPVSIFAVRFIKSKPVDGILISSSTQ